MGREGLGKEARKKRGRGEKGQGRKEGGGRKARSGQKSGLKVDKTTVLRPSPPSLLKDLCGDILSPNLRHRLIHFTSRVVFFSACVFEHSAHAWCLQRSELEFWESNVDLLQGQQALRPTEPSL